MWKIIIILDAPRFEDGNDETINIFAEPGAK